MAIKVFYIPFGYKGSTEYLFRIAVENIKGLDFSEILYIAPTPRKVMDSRQIFHRLTGNYYIPPAMMTIKQLSKRLYSLYEDKKIIPRFLLPIIISKLSNIGIGYASIIDDFINEIKQYHPEKNLDSITKELKCIFNDLGIPEDVSARALESLDIFRKYQELLFENSIVDENDVLSACPYLFKRHFNNVNLIIDGFYELTKSEELIIKVLIEKANNTIISVPYNPAYSITDSYINFLKNYFKVEENRLSFQKETAEPICYSYPGIEEEIEGIARNIKNSFISGKLRDLEKIVISFPTLPKYRDSTERIFKRYGIPFSISSLKPLGKGKPFLDLFALLESIAEDYPRLLFSHFLRSPYFINIPPVLREYIANICPVSGLIKGKNEWLKFLQSEVMRQKSEIANKDILTKLKKGLNWVFDKLTFLEAIKDNGSYGQYGENIMKLVKDFGFSKINNQNIDLQEQVFKLIKELSFIDSLGIFSSTVPVTLRNFIDAMKHVANATFVEAEGTGVQILDFFEAQGMEPDYLYLGGLRDGDLPSKPDTDHILPDSVRTRFGLVNLNRYLSLQRFVFQRLVESTNNIHLTYPEMEGDKVFLPSPFLPWKKEMKKHVYGIFSKEEELLGKGKTPFSYYIRDIENIDKKFIRTKFGGNACLRVTDIDSYRVCPRKFFIEKVLNLEPLEIKEYKVEAMTMGIIAHEIMQHLISRPFSSFDDLMVNAEKVIMKILSDKPIEDYWNRVIKDTFLSIIPEIYKIERKIINEGYSFMDAEVSVEGEIIKGIKLKGKIDRVDRKNSQIELIDYKSGAIQFSGQQVLTKGATLQLFLYAALMRSLNFNVKRVGIYSLKDIKLSWIPGRKDIKEEKTLDDYIDVSLRFLEETVSRMRKGDFAANPLNELSCWNCAERAYCPYIQKTVTNKSLFDKYEKVS